MISSDRLNLGQSRKGSKTFGEIERFFLAIRGMVIALSPATEAGLEVYEFWRML